MKSRIIKKKKKRISKCYFETRIYMKQTIGTCSPTNNNKIR